MENTLLCTVVFIVSISNVEILTMLDSRVFNKRMFSMMWLEMTHLRVRTLGLAGNLLDNVPQLIIQGLFIGENGITGIAIASMIASAISLLFGIMRKLILFLVLKFSPEHSNSSKRQSMVSATEASEMIMMM